MHILYVITGLGLGGAEKVVIDLADQMNALGHNVKIAYLTGEVLVKPKCTDIEIIALRLNSVKYFLLASRRYQQLIKRFKPNVIHAHMVHANIFSRLNRTVCSTPKLICTAHSSNEGGKVRMLAYRLTNHLSDINTNVSQEATESLIHKGAFSKNNLMTVYNGIDINRYVKGCSSSESEKKSLNFITVGRFTDPKDYPNLINAFALFRKKNGIDSKLIIIGDGELRSKIETLIKELYLTKYVTLLGQRSDIPQLLNRADIFLLASKFEGLPTVIIEAMACECYVIATDCGGSAEILGDTGKLVPIQDSQSLAEAMEETIKLSIEDRLQNNARARVRVEKLFSLEASVQKWLKLYETE